MSTRSEHTPGPWSIHNNIGRKSELGIVASAAPCIIAIMGNQKEWPREAHDNARLISAAPELLDALKALVNCPDYKGIKTHEMIQALAAIRKAEGE